MKAIILAAGRGKRMKSYTENLPKCLVNVRGKSLLAWQLSALQGAGISEIGIVTGYKRELLSEFGLKEFYNPQWEQTQMVSSLTFADEWLKLEPCIVSYSDIFYEATAVCSLMECDASLAVTYDPSWLSLWKQRFVDPLTDAETFRISSHSNLIEIGNKPNSVEDVQGQYMGLLRFTPEGWNEVFRQFTNLSDYDANKLHMTSVLQMVIEGGQMNVAAVPYIGEWGEVDSAEDLANYNRN